MNNELGEQATYNSPKFRWSSFLSSPGLVSVMVLPHEIEGLTSAFSVYRHTKGGTISHGLATALINRDGKIEKIWRGNGWTPAEVTEVIQAADK